MVFEATSLEELNKLFAEEVKRLSEDSPDAPWDDAVEHYLQALNELQMKPPKRAPQETEEMWFGKLQQEPEASEEVNPFKRKGHMDKTRQEFEQDYEEAKRVVEEQRRKRAQEEQSAGEGEGGRSASKKRGMDDEVRGGSGFGEEEDEGASEQHRRQRRIKRRGSNSESKPLPQNPFANVQFSGGE